MATPSRRDRLVDVIALLLIIAGIALYLDGTARLREIGRLSYHHPGARGVSALHSADVARWTANSGLALAAAGCVVAATAALRMSRRARIS